MEWQLHVEYLTRVISGLWPDVLTKDWLENFLELRSSDLDMQNLNHWCKETHMKKKVT